MNPMGRDGLPEGYGEARMRRQLAEILVGMGAQVAQSYPIPERPNITAFFDFGAPETIIFEAHLDTVPVAELSHDAFSGDQRDGRIYGRGACDVKGPTAAMICAIEQTVARGKAARNVLFAGVVDEEYQFSGVRHLLVHIEPAIRDTIMGAVVAEPTRLEPVAGHKGVVRWIAATKGTAAHSSTPEQGDNAIYSMAEVVLSLCNYAVELRGHTAHPMLGVPTLSVGTIRGGTAVNMVPDYCEIEIDRRLVPGETIDRATREVAGIIEPLGARLSAPIVAAPPFVADLLADPAQAMVEAARVANHDAQFRYVNYCTDATFYAAAGIPAIVFGPGNIEQAHSAEEWIAIDELERAVDAYARMLGA